MNESLSSLLFFGWIVALLVFFANKATKTQPTENADADYRNLFAAHPGTATFGAMFPNPDVPWHDERRTNF